MDRFRAALISTRADDRICSTVSLRLAMSPELLRWPIAYERPLQLTDQDLDGKRCRSGAVECMGAVSLLWQFVAQHPSLIVYLIPVRSMEHSSIIDASLPGGVWPAGADWMTLWRFNLLICGLGLHFLRSGNYRRCHINNLFLSVLRMSPICWSNWEQSYEHTVHYYPRHSHLKSLNTTVFQDSSITATALHILCVFTLYFLDREDNVCRGLRRTRGPWNPPVHPGSDNGLWVVGGAGSSADLRGLFYFFSFSLSFLFLFFFLLFFVLSPVSSYINYTYG